MPIAHSLHGRKFGRIPGRSAGMNGPNRIELAFAVIVGSLYSCDLLRLLFAGEAGEGDVTGSNWFRLIMIMIYGLTAFLLVLHRRALGRRLAEAPLLITLCIIPLVSVLWSTSWQTTLTRAITLIGSSSFGYYLAIRFPPRELLSYTCVCALVVASASLVLILMFPSLGIYSAPYSGAWRGAFLHKNGLGASMALQAGLVSLYLICIKDKPLIFPIVSLIVCLLLLIGSKSATAQVAFICSVGSIFFIRHVFGAAPIFLSTLPLQLMLIGYAANGGLSDIISVFGKDLSLTGRIPIWEAIWPYVLKKPWLGYGYEAFWAPTQSAVRVIEDIIHFRPFYSHNGVVELLLSLGIMGAMLFSALFVTFLVRFARVAASQPLHVFSSLGAVYLVAFTVQNISEVSILAPNDMGWCLFIALYLRLGDAIGNPLPRT